MRLKTKSLVLTLVLAFTAHNAEGAILLGYTAGQDPTLTGDALPASEVDSTITATSLAMASGLALNTTAGNFQGSGYDPASTSFEDAIAANDFWSFSFEVNAGGSVLLESLTIDLFRDADGPANYELRASLNGATPAVLDGVIPVDTLGAQDVISFVGTSFENLSAGDQVLFQLAGFDSTTSAGELAFDDFGTAFDPESFGGGLVIRGTATAVPEPGAMLALSMVGLVAISKRRRKSCASAKA